MARIDALAARIEEAKGLRAQAMADVEAIGRTILFDNRHRQILHSLCESLSSCGRPTSPLNLTQLYQFAGVYCFGRGVFRSTTKRGYRVLILQG